MKFRLVTNVRWRISAMFVALSSVLYLTLSLLGTLAFHWGLNFSIDQELKVLASELGHAIELNGGTPHFRDWLRVAQTEPARSLAAIQLYNSQGLLIEHYGPVGPSMLVKTKNEIPQFRLIVSPLTKNSQLMGFLQIALPTQYRDDAMQKLEITIACLAPILLLGLGITGYVVSDAATAPIRENLRLLKQFVADASHELNTPISILRARAEVLEKRLRRDNWNVEDVVIIASATERMEKIVGDLMLLAELEGTLTGASEDSVCIDETLKSVVAEFRTKFDDKGIVLQIAQCQPIAVKVSQEGMHRIFSNLVENAWRYTETGGRVTLSVVVENSFARIEISDTGIGIPADCIPLVFDRFYRVDKSRSRASGGSGLGLSIVKALVDSHKGHVNVASKVGEGSTFTVFLPVEH